MDPDDNAFERYMLSEYENIAQAHFKSTETISAFFRYYLLIMSLPLSAFALIGQQLFDSSKRYLIEMFLADNRVLLFLILSLISIIGLFVFCYVANLRLDAILYARTINGLRKRQYDKEEEDINLKLRFRVLPQSPLLPAYHEKNMFWPVVIVFGLINSIYLFLGCCFISIQSFLFRGFPKASTQNIVLFLIIIPGAFFLMHFLLYYVLAMHREKSYLRSNIIGIDIDGVINKHREHFCPLLKTNAGKELSPSDILVMPVHEDKRHNIGRDDEYKVFNDPKYWTDMPKVDEDISRIFKDLRKTLGFKLHIFTHRPWPMHKDEEELKRLKRVFLNACSHISYMDRLKNLFSINKTLPLKQITKEWLKKHDLIFNRFYLETGNEYYTTYRGRYRNRFWIARTKKIRYFIEDDIEKAIKLSYICDVVFLISHPYNSTNIELPPDVNQFRANIPQNIVRVDNWDEIKHLMRRYA